MIYSCGHEHPHREAALACQAREPVYVGFTEDATLAVAEAMAAEGLRRRLMELCDRELLLKLADADRE